MHRIPALAILGLLALPCSAEVLRCTDAKGNVSYTDSACPSSAKQVANVAILAPPDPDPHAEANRLRALENQAQVRSRDPALAQPVTQPVGPVVMNTPAGGGDAGADPDVDYGYGYGYGYGGGWGRPLPPRDMRPRIRNCDATGCNDRQGNRYDHTGQLTSYRSLGGQTCRVVGTTQVCR